MGATITVHHLMYERNDMLAGGIRPHLYCLPILKRSLHRDALIEAATSGASQFSSVPILLHMRSVIKSPIAAVLDATPHLSRSSCMPKCSRHRVNSIDSKHLRVSTVLTFMVCPEIQRPSLSQKLRHRSQSRGLGDTEVRLLRGGETVAWSLT